MKNILLATTALVMSAGFASAEVTLSGTAHAGMKNSTGAASTVYSGMTAKFAASTTTDNGLTMSISESIGGGTTLDLADMELDDTNTEMGVPTMTIAGGGITVVMKNNAIGNYYDADGDDGDIGVSGKFGDLSWGVTAETNSDVGAVSNSYKLGYTMGAIGLTMVGNDNDQSKATASYTMGDTVFSAYSKNTGTATVIGGGVDLTLNGATVSYTGNDADEWNLSVGYVLDAVTIAYSTSEDKDWQATAVYDLGGGASIEAGTNEANTSHVGIVFAF